ncbi:transcriptional regulator, PadR family [Marinactinospora thermotolerans DSM 45154]|uniref:Transcriptional regulator, PadR family n=1 Tax=Marinactinospora thermotolerans DSM 45154 TaxID=1122192 RepID=A0A1T4SDN2_9ACTN|nr:PadR family transcriptional regulator [Marinactinospora thermotolerans]SKA26285.1 transcriptional regulator, PadR family [Marinactinospora thermotolerans DSM 45154]
MSTIFGHGRLRLYLLKLLDESPRHGYEIISLLRDRFLGVYSPSPGTIYPRLSRLEEEGLVTHEVVDGRKVYRLTDKGREELHARASELDDLEREITDSVRDIARAVKQDVRDTISSLREELKSAAGGSRGRRDRQTPSESDEDVWARAGAEDPTASAGRSRGERGRHERGEGEEGERKGPWWGHDWERFSQGFPAWGRRGEHGQRPEFEQALRDFSERVSDTVRGAGETSTQAAGHLRRILDDTLEVIRRDISSWGPPERQDRPASEGAPGPRPPEPGPAGEGDTPRQDSGPRPSDPGGDPWASATREPPADTEDGPRPQG